MAKSSLHLFQLQSHHSIRSLSPSFYCLLLILAISISPLYARGPDAVEPNRDGIALHVPQSELIYEGLVSYGNYQLFGAAEGSKLYIAGVEYDREFWPHFLGGRLDYVSELLPVLILSQPAKTDFWGAPLSRERELIPGFGITPLGARLLWRDRKLLMPYFEVKGSVLGFSQKALSPDSTYENWSFQLSAGLKLKLRGRYDLRVGLLNDLHFSNGFVVRSNPALDVMNANVGIVYHLRGWRSSR
jgi:hypothetical protein